MLLQVVVNGKRHGTKVMHFLSLLCTTMRPTGVIKFVNFSRLFEQLEVNKDLRKPNPTTHLPLRKIQLPDSIILCIASEKLLHGVW